MSLLLALQGAGTITFSSNQALPLAGAVVLQDPIALSSTKPLPLTGSVVLTDPIRLSTTGVLPLGGTVTITVRTNVTTIQALPLGGEITLTTGAAAPVVPVVGGPPPRRFVLDKRRAVRVAVSLPIRFPTLQMAVYATVPHPPASIVLHLPRWTAPQPAVHITVNPPPEWLDDGEIVAVLVGIEEDF